MKKNRWNHAEETMLPRSRLYPIIPLGLRTAWVESLTSYINRLAWAYRVSPRVLVAQEIVPNLRFSRYLHQSSGKLGAFCRSHAMTLNGTGEVARDWALTLEQLTMRSDLRYLTLRSFVDGLPSRGLPRPSPAWCAACYQHWHEEGYPIYQPLLWTLQTMTVCPHHKKLLQEQCPKCQKRQSPLASDTRPGACTQCGAWLGEKTEEKTFQEIDNETLIWQGWVMRIIEELHQAAMTSEALPWNKLAVGLNACVQALGTKDEAIRLTGVTLSSLNWWLNGTRMPSFERLLDLCYALNISPLQVITADSPLLQQVMHAPRPLRAPRPKHTRHLIDREGARDLIQAVLSGKEPPLAIRQIERRLGLGHRTLVQRFPEECALITAQYQTARAQQASQRVARVCEEVQRVTLALHAQGISPGFAQVRARLSNPNMLRTPEGLTTWHSVRRVLGLEAE